MATKLDQQRKLHQEQINKEVLAAIEFELVGAIAHSGAELHGFSVKIGKSDCLMVLRATIGSKPVVSFIGAPDISNCFRRAVVEAYHDGLRWKEDEFAKK